VILRPRAILLPVAALLFILVGLALAVPHGSPWADRLWLVGLVLTGLPVVLRTIKGIFTGRLAADLVAMLAIVAAVLLREPLAGLIVVLMQTGGEALERYAEGRASDAVRELEAAAPRSAHRLSETGVEDIGAEAVAPGDLLLVRPGEMVPCDGVVTAGESHVDTSRLTGEPVPIHARAETPLASGSLNLEGPLTLRATAVSSESQYARIVELVRSAQASKSPLQRLADRYAVWFTPITLSVCIVAYVLSHDPVRVLAVLVVATPCPLILATPVAVIGGINRAARRSVIFRNGESLEQLGTIDVAVFDKTGTLTIGRPEVARVLPLGGRSAREVLRLAGAVEQGSGHLLARTVVEAALASDGPLPAAHGITEAPGQGVSGRVEGVQVSVGSLSFLNRIHPEASTDFEAALPDGGGLRAFVGVDGRAAGIIEYADSLRPDLVEFFGRLRTLGITRTLLLTGDHQVNADVVARAAGIGEVHADLLPADKVDIVRRVLEEGARVLMVGDGTNDAPALSSATVGIALAAHGGGITAEAADVVILADDLTRVSDAIVISRETLHIARQSIWVGLGLSTVAMGVASWGMIPPTVGAILQEIIDVAVILNALRTSRDS
jgi:heavy metal translocating P-type ATPase